MFSDILICVFSYNRGDLLGNLLSSVNQYYPEAGLAVFDDGSDEPAVKRILNDLPQDVHVHITDKASPGSRHGGLYYMMGKAIDYAKGSAYKYAYFVQDDMQFLWRDEQLMTKLESVFRKDHCLMCNFNFHQKIFKKDIVLDLQKTIEPGLYEYPSPAILDTGIVDIERARSADLKFPFQTEKMNGAYWYDKGYRMYWMAQPHIAYTPWPKIHRYKHTKERKLYRLKKIDGRKQSQLKENTGLAYLEDYTSTETWLLKPYWYGSNPGLLNLTKIYIKYFLGIQLLNQKLWQG